mgnify:CR=1 FL=1
MFGFGKKKLFEQHQRNLLTCLLFGEFALNSAEESANSDQIEFWETKIGKLRRLQGASLRTGGILDKNDATFVDTFLEKCEATFASISLTKPFGSLSFNHFPSFHGDLSLLMSGNRTKGWPHFWYVCPSLVQFCS